MLGTNQLQGNNETVRLATERYYLHPDYNPTTLDNDIGIIKLRAKIPFSGELFSSTILVVKFEEYFFQNTSILLIYISMRHLLGQQLKQWVGDS